MIKHELLKTIKELRLTKIVDNFLFSVTSCFFIFLKLPKKLSPCSCLEASFKKLPLVDFLLHTLQSLCMLFCQSQDVGKWTRDAACLTLSYITSTSHLGILGGRRAIFWPRQWVLRVIWPGTCTLYIIYYIICIYIMKLTSLSLRLLTAQKILMKGPDSWKFSKIPCFFYSICLRGTYEQFH